MSKVHVKTGDTVVILSGKDRGKKGKIMAVSPKEGKVIVENANIVSKHVKPRKMGEAGGIIKASPRSTPARSRLFAPAAASRPVSPTKCLRMAQKSAFAKNAASRFNLEGIKWQD